MKLNISNCRPLTTYDNKKVIQFTLSFLDDDDLPYVSCNGMLYNEKRRVMPTRAMRRGAKIVELREDLLEALENRLAGIPEVQKALGDLKSVEKQYLNVDENWEVPCHTT